MLVAILQLVRRGNALVVALRALNLRKSFGWQVILADVSVSFSAGSITTLVGPSGSGKTTLLTILAGFVRPDSGAVEMLDQRIWEPGFSNRGRESLRRRHCGIIFQQPNLMPALTAQQQLQIALEWASDVSPSEIRRTAVETLTRLGLRDHLNARPHHLSGGEKQRVAVARAIAKRPRVLFADEPTAALDWNQNGRIVFDMLRSAARDDGTAVVIASHDDRIADRSDCVLRIDDGQLVEK